MSSVSYFKLRAIHPEKKIFREYNLHLSKDLFGFWLLQANYGRIGSTGKTKSYGFQDYRVSFDKMMTLLNKRLKSRKKMGCPYQIVDLELDPMAIPEKNLNFQRASKAGV